VRVAKTKEPTISWADIAVSGTRSPRSDGGEEEEKEADHQRIQTGYGDEYQAEDGKNTRGQQSFEWCSVGTERRTGTGCCRRK